MRLFTYTSALYTAKTLHNNGYAANVQGYRYIVFQTITTVNQLFGKRYFYNLVHHNALAYDVRG